MAHPKDRVLTTKIHIGITDIEEKDKLREIIMPLVIDRDVIIEFAKTDKIRVDVLIPQGRTNLVGETQHFVRDFETAELIKRRVEMFFDYEF